MMRWLRSLVAPAELEATPALAAVVPSPDLPEIQKAPPPKPAAPTPPSSEALEEAMASKNEKDFIRWMYATPKEQWSLVGGVRTFYSHLMAPKGSQKFNRYDRAEIAQHALQLNIVPSRREMPALIDLLLSEEEVEHVGPFEKLLDMGAHPCLRIDASSWLVKALLQGKPALALLLLQRGALVTDRNGHVRHELLCLAFQRMSRDSFYASMKSKMDFYKSSYDYDGLDDDGERKKSVPALLKRGDRLNTRMEELVLALLERGVDINHVQENGETAYALVNAEMRSFLEERGALPRGKGSYGVEIAAQLLAASHFDELKKVLAFNPNALLEENGDGTLAVSHWWGLSPTRASAALAFFKKNGVWNDILGAHDRHGRNFLTAGLAKLIGKGPDKDKENELSHRLEWPLGRLETEIHSSMWVDPDQGGETLNFWLGVARTEGLMAKYVLPRRELMLKSALSHVDQALEDQPSNQSRRARL